MPATYIRKTILTVKILVILLMPISLEIEEMYSSLKLK